MPTAARGVRHETIAITSAMALVVALVVALTTTDATAAPPKHYTVEISPTSITGSGNSATETVTFTFTNLQSTAGGITLGSANITVPDGVEVLDDGVDDVIELRTMGLTKGTSESWSFDIVAACPEDDATSVDYTWPVQAKQSNEFSGEGNDFTLNGGYPVLTVTCIEDEEDESEDPGNGQQQGPSPGFTPEGGWDQSVFCPGNSPCPDLEDSLNGTTATLSSPNATAMFLSLRNDAELECTDFVAQSAAVYFDVIGNPQGKTIAITLEGASGGPGDYEVCFGGDKPWTTKDGSPAVFDGDTFWVGIAGECAATPGRRPPGAKGGLGQPVPCVDMNASSANEDGVTIVLRVPPGDPLIKIG